MAEDTDPRMSGELATAMRWRPDLVTAADDSDLIPLGSETHGYTGRFNAQVFERASDPTVWHLRLDDGHRFIGVDLDNVGGRQDPISVDLVGRVREAWQRLERELTDPAHAVPNGVIEDGPWVDWTDIGFVDGFVDETEDPWADVMQAVFSRGAAAMVVRPSDHNPIVRTVGEPASADVRAQMLAISERLAAAVVPSAPAVEAFLRVPGIALTDWQRSVVEQMASVQSSGWPRTVGFHARRLPRFGFRPIVNRRDAAALRAHGYRDGEHFEVYLHEPPAESPAPPPGPDEPPTDPMQRALWLRRHRNTGPAPDRLDGRRRHRR